jgi:hypothetical protein
MLGSVEREVQNRGWGLFMFMRIALLALGVLALADTTLMAQPRRRDQPAGEYGWLSSLEAGKMRARTSGKPLMVVLRCVP